jgi:hydroxyethylthiazole kinase
MFSKCLENVKTKNPLIHNITNYVTVNDCANILLACGASPIMADDINEVEEITTICGGLNINIGTLNERTINSMFAAGEKANELKHPVILDPVGAGASSFRTNTAKKLLQKIKFTVIKGNISEIKTLALGEGTTKGVDADALDAVTEDTIDNAIELAKSFSKKTEAIVVITGAIDIVADSEKAYVIRNGVEMMSKITGSGCMLTAMTAAYMTANPENIIESVVASICAMGLCGEIAFEKMKKEDTGNSSYRNYLIDEIFKLDGDKLKEGVKVEMR